MPPTTGRTLLYILNESDAEQINRRRMRNSAEPIPRGAVWHVGNHAQAGDVVPFIVVRVWPNEYGDQPGINGQAILDGNDSLWITSAKEGTEPGTWQWPPRV